MESCEWQCSISCFSTAFCSQWSFLVTVEEINIHNEYYTKFGQSQMVIEGVINHYEKCLDGDAVTKQVSVLFQNRIHKSIISINCCIEVHVLWKTECSLLYCNGCISPSIHFRSYQDGICLLQRVSYQLLHNAHCCYTASDIMLQTHWLITHLVRVHVYIYIF